MRRLAEFVGAPDLVFVRAGGIGISPHRDATATAHAGFPRMQRSSIRRGRELEGRNQSVHATASRCAAIARRLGGRRHKEAQQMNATGRALPHTRVHAVVLGLSARKVRGNNGGAVFGGDDQGR